MSEKKEVDKNSLIPDNLVKEELIFLLTIRGEQQAQKSKFNQGSCSIHATLSWI